MDKKLEQLIEHLNLNPGAPKDLVRKAELELGVSLSQEYIEFILSSNGAEGPIGASSYLVIWPIDELAQINTEYPVKYFAPSLLLFGSDGGGTGFAFDTRTDKLSIFEVPFLGTSFEDAKLCGHTFIEFLEYLHDRFIE